MTATAIKRSTTTNLDEILNSNVRKATATKQKETVKAEDSRFENIAANTFHKIMFDPAMTPEQKKSAVAKALVFAGTKEENRERVKEFETFKEFLQHHRETMASEIIKLTDTETFSELKQAYEDFNNSLIDFDNRMKPLTDIIDSIYTLRTNGVAYDAFVELQSDRVKEEEAAARKSALAGEVNNIDGKVMDIDVNINSLKNQRKFFGFGGITEEAQAEIYRLEEERRRSAARMSEIQNEIAELETKSSEPTGEFAQEKKHLRELLDITTDEHKERQKQLVDAALTFVTTARERIGSVREHLGQMNGQVENLYDANGNMTRVYATLNEGIKEAEGANQKIRAELSVEKENEDLITKMTREQKKMEVESHITMLDTSAADTITTYADLTSQSIRIKTMKDANDAQIAKARNMHSQGVAGVADRLSVVLQAVSSAALGESSALAKDTLVRMADNTNRVAQKESIRIAMGITDTNNEISKVMDDLAAYGEVARTATDITRQGITEMREKLDELQNISKQVQGDIKEGIAVNAEVGLGLTKKAEPAKKEVKTNPFAI